MNTLNNSNSIPSFEELFKKFTIIAQKYSDAHTEEMLVNHDKETTNAMHREQKIMMQKLLKDYTLWKRVDMLQSIHNHQAKEWLELKTKPYIEKHILYSIVSELEIKITTHFASMEKGETAENFNDFLEKHNVSIEEMKILVELMKSKESSYLRSYWEDHKTTYEWIIQDLSRYIKIHEAFKVQWNWASQLLATLNNNP